ncbi:MAG: hypothetical protein IT576_19995, partial [Verrucomicrobiales bacterium]|nr:hypothetical protein [Verrucomicrobiales bacterium]
MPAYKIIYGAGPTLTRDESRFGRGYGFVGMHREPAIKTLAYEVLERPLHGKNIFELDKGLARAGAELHSFQRMGDWWVFLRISAKQTESRLWSFEEFLLLDDAEVDALVARGISPVQVFRFDGEGSDGRPLWYRDPLWSEPATWYTEPLSFKGISFPDLVAEPSPGLLPFRYPTCSWIVPEFGDGASLPDLLNAFGLAGQSLRHKCYPGITREEFKELFWNRLSFTTYHLDPARVFDLNFATGKHQTWMAFWQGSHDPKQYETEEALSWPADEQSLPEEPSEDEMKAAGWLRVCPEEQTHPSKLQSDPIVSGSQHTNESYHERRPKSNKKQVWSNKKLLVIGGATFAFLLLGALVSFSYLRLKRQAERGERI